MRDSDFALLEKRRAKQLLIRELILWCLFMAPSVICSLWYRSMSTAKLVVAITFFAVGIGFIIIAIWHYRRHCQAIAQIDQPTIKKRRLFIVP